MTTASTATVVDQTTDAAFRTWVAEVIAQLIAVGLTQTADTGQINTSTVTRAAVVNTAAGYTIWRFNDTLQGTSPVFIKVEFGTGSTQPANPQMWVTVGTGSNGSGTITGTTTLRVAVTVGSPPSSTVTSYTSRFVYNSTFGFLGICWKQNGYGTATIFMGAFFVFRSNDNTGAATGDAVICLSSSTSSTGTASLTGNMQIASYLTSVVYPLSFASNGPLWVPNAGSAGIPFNATTTSFGGNSQVFPVIYQTPVFSYSAYMGIGLIAEEPIGSTFSSALVGSTALTFLSVGQPFGSLYIGPNTSATQTLNILWQ